MALLMICSRSAAAWLLSGEHLQMQDVLMRYATALSLLDASGDATQGAGGYPPGLHPGDLTDNILDSLALSRRNAQVDNFNAYFSLGMFEQKRIIDEKQP